MKRFFIILLFMHSVIFSQEHKSSIKFGLNSPSATGSGFIIGYEWNKVIDNNFSLGWSVDWFNKNYTDQSLVKEFNKYYGVADSYLNELRAKTNLHDIPLMFTANINFPYNRKTNFYATGSIGGELLLINYRSFDNPDDDNMKVAFDFSWRVGMGVLYQLGERSDLIAELSYHHSEPSWKYEVDSGNMRRIFERRFDMSGLMLRVGVSFYY